MQFDILAFADYSGARHANLQKKHIVLAQQDSCEPVQVYQGLTRATLHQSIRNLLLESSEKRRRVFFGFDFNYSFPDGFYQVLVEESWHDWQQLLDLLTNGTDHIPPLSQYPRQWALEINLIISRKLGFTAGPFWGPGFVQNKNPHFPHDQNNFSARRLVERAMPRMKPVYQIGGIGAGGFQALYGIRYLAGLRNFCFEKQILLHCWPFDGWKPPEDSHVLIEIYPGFYNQGTKSDHNDAVSCVNWFKSRLTQNQFSRLFNPPLSEQAQSVVRREGWIPGIPPKNIST